jgi:hypothetical protein
MDRLSPQDSWFLHIENRVNHMHVGAVLIFGGPAPSHTQLRRMVMSKLPLVPRLRQRLQVVSFQIGRPAWVDDGGFDLDHHLRRVALPRREVVRNWRPSSATSSPDNSTEPDPYGSFGCSKGSKRAAGRSLRRSITA